MGIANLLYSTSTVPWAQSNKGFTLLFEAYVMSLVELEMPVKCVAELVGEHDQRIWNIFHRHTSRARSNTDYSGITRVGIDETSSRKGHDYVTPRVLGVRPCSKSGSLPAGLVPPSSKKRHNALYQGCQHHQSALVGNPQLRQVPYH